VVSPAEFGLAKEGKDAYIQCLDPKNYTGGGTVTFKISRIDWYKKIPIGGVN
jgi:hypothetical protein